MGGGGSGGGWLEKLRIRLTSASTEVGVEVGAELLVLMILHPVVKTCFGLIGKGLRYYLDGR